MKQRTTLSPPEMAIAGPSEELESKMFRPVSRKTLVCGIAVFLAVWAALPVVVQAAEFQDLGSWKNESTNFYASNMILSDDGDYLQRLGTTSLGWGYWNRSRGWIDTPGYMSEDANHLVYVHEDAQLIEISGVKTNSSTTIDLNDLNVPGEVHGFEYRWPSQTGTALAGTLLWRNEPPTHWDGVLWTGRDGLTFLPRHPGYDYPHDLRAAADGTVVFGFLGHLSDSDQSEDKAFRWTSEEGIRLLDLGLPIADDVRDLRLPSSGELNVTGDGRIAFGRIAGEEGQWGELFRWSEDEGAVRLGVDGYIWANTPDASVLGGTVYTGYEWLAGRATENLLRGPALLWTRDDGILDVGNGVIADLTPDGSVAVGKTAGESGIPWATYWHRKSGTLLPLQDVLVNEYGLGDALTGWTLLGAEGISADGLTIAGIAESPDGEIDIWLADIDYPLTWIYDGNFVRDETLNVDDIDRLSAAILANSSDLVYDLNDDQLVDVADLQFWVNDLFGTWVGDVNLDGEFDTSDLVNVFQAGKYEFDTAATWSDGDWNADGRFTTGDLVAAFQDGGYEQGARASATAIPEPTSGIIAVAGLLGMCVGRRWQAR